MAAIRSMILKCKTCGVEFKSPMMIGDTQSFDGGRMGAGTCPCPNHHMAQYGKNDIKVVLADGTVYQDFPV